MFEVSLHVLHNGKTIRHQPNITEKEVYFCFHMIYYLCLYAISVQNYFDLNKLYNLTFE